MKMEKSMNLESKEITNNFYELGKLLNSQDTAFDYLAEKSRKAMYEALRKEEYKAIRRIRREIVKFYNDFIDEFSLIFDDQTISQYLPEDLKDKQINLRLKIKDLVDDLNLALADCASA